jgi:hypothetical protein
MRCIALALLAALAGCAVAGPPRPLLWKVSDANNHVYLLGSFHALQASDYPLSPKVTAAFDDAEKIAFEISPEEMHSPELPRKMMAAAALPEGRTLQSSIDAASWLRLQHYAKLRGFPLDGYQRVEPWFMSLVISLKEMARQGYEPELGLDQHLIALAAQSGKPATGLESAEEQIAALDSMSPAEQEQSLSESLDGSEDASSRIDLVHAHWRAGDEKALEEMMTTEFKRDYAQLYQRINVGRNQAWLPKIRRMLDAEDHDDVLVVVGSLHLLGSDGLVSQLRSKGYRVERL